MKKVMALLMVVVMAMTVVSIPDTKFTNPVFVIEAEASSSKVTDRPTSSNVPKNQTVKRGEKVRLTAPKNTTLYYTRTFDGSTPRKPTVKSKKVDPGKTRSLTISQTTRVRVIAVRKGRTESSSVSRTYKVPVTKKPSSSNVPKSQTVKKGTKITLTAPKNTTLYYTTTTNGSKPSSPTLKSKKLNPGKSVSIKVSKETRIRVMARRSGRSQSSTVSRTYKLKGSSSSNSIPNGTYRVTAFTVDGQRISDKATVNQMNNQSGNLTLKFSGDKITSTSYGMSSTSKYTFNGKKLTFKEFGISMSLDAKFKDNTLFITLEEGGTKIVLEFKR